MGAKISACDAARQRTRLAWWPDDPAGRWPRGRGEPQPWFLAALREARKHGPRWMHPDKYVAAMDTAWAEFLSAIERDAMAMALESLPNEWQCDEKPMQRAERIRDENLSADRTHKGYLI